jgi:glycerol kinase
MSQRILVLDEGTSSTRAALYDRVLRRTVFQQEAVGLSTPEAHIVEQDPAEIWSRTRDVALRAAAGEVPAAVAITNQRETTILWDRATGQPVHPALVWQDRRGAELCAAFRADGREAELTAATGLLADPYFSGFKIAWLLETVPGLRARCEAGQIAFGTVDSWLIWNLTGGAVHATDASNASRTGLYDIRTGAWSDAMLALFDVPAAILPQVRDSAGDFGTTRLFGPPVPVVGVLGDQQAALMGQGCVRPGEAKITFGTGAFLMAQTGGQLKPSTARLLTTVAWQTGGRLSYAMEGAILNAGTAIQWLRDGLGLIGQSADVSALAASVPDSGGVHLVPAFTGLGAPHWDPQARGLISGIGRGTTKAHIARATLEASAFQTAELLAALAADGIELYGLGVDGGMAASDLFLQSLADITGLPVTRPQDLEMTALGAARVAALALGWGVSGQEQDGPDAQTFQPGIDAPERTVRMAAWSRAVSAARSIGGWTEGPVS